MPSPYRGICPGYRKVIRKNWKHSILCYVPFIGHTWKVIREIPKVIVGYQEDIYFKQIDRICLRCGLLQRKVKRIAFYTKFDVWPDDNSELESYLELQKSRKY